MGLFNDRATHLQKEIVPVWFMRQAGRYHGHYQNIKKNSDFMTMCKDPSLATNVTMGPIEEFNFDAAILFSDLLFPLEKLGMGLSYKSGPPTLEFRLEKNEDLKKLNTTHLASDFFKFQKEACQKLRATLPKNKTLIGFVGAPFTLYTYAVEGSHSGSLSSSKNGFYDGRFQGFMEHLIPDVLDEMCLQAEGGADAIALFDTAAGELTLNDYKQFVLPQILKLTGAFKNKFPQKKIIYYSKMTHQHYLEALVEKDQSLGQSIDVLGVDWRMNLREALLKFGNKYYIQGNLDPSHLHLPKNILLEKLKELWGEVTRDADRDGVPLNKWIMGLGHGVLQHTPEENVLGAVEFIHQNFHYSKS